MPAYYLEIFVIALGLAMLAMDAFAGKAGRGVIAMTGIGGLAVVLIFLGFAACCPAPDLNYWGVYHYDKTAAFFKGIALAATLLVLVMARESAPVVRRYTSQDEESAGLGEFYSLPVFACAGLMWMASARDLITIFVALEVVTMAFYVLVAYLRRNVGSLEAGVKYLILGALSTGFLVYGIAWTYGVTGEFQLDAIGARLASGEVATAPALFAFALLFVGLAFKVAAVPFQIWVPDVYQGAPMPVTAFLSVASKAAGFVVLLQVTEPFLAASAISTPVVTLLSFVIAATLLFGNFAAIPQTNVKRLLAYSSIAHAGFLLLALPAIGHRAEIHVGLSPVSAISFYLGAYLLMTMLCFLVLTLVRVASDGEDLDSLRGLSKRSPFLAFALLVGMAALAGIPLTIGFWGKFFLIGIAVQDALAGGSWILVGIAIGAAAAGFYYYFKVIRAMYWEEPREETPPPLAPSRLATAAIVVLLAAVLLLGLNPQPLIALF